MSLPKPIEVDLNQRWFLMQMNVAHIAKNKLLQQQFIILCSFTHTKITKMFQIEISHGNSNVFCYAKPISFLLFRTLQNVSRHVVCVNQIAISSEAVKLLIPIFSFNMLNFASNLFTSIFEFCYQSFGMNII